MSIAPTRAISRPSTRSIPSTSTPTNRRGYSSARRAGSVRSISRWTASLSQNETTWIGRRDRQGPLEPLAQLDVIAVWIGDFRAGVQALADQGTPHDVDAFGFQERDRLR